MAGKDGGAIRTIRLTDEDSRIYNKHFMKDEISYATWR